MSQSEMSAEQARRELYETMQADTPFETKAERALELGEAYLEVENGHLTQIDRDADYWESIASTDPPEGEFPAGLVLDLDRTYCRRVIEEDDSIPLHDAPEQGWADDPAFDAHELHCYHGTPLTIDGEPYGTVCFVSKERRDAPFTDDDTLFAELIARMLEHELEHAQQKAELNRRADLTTVLSRVLRHNLRNDMAVIRGRLRMIEDRFDTIADHCEPAVERIDELLELSNTARTLESIVTTKFDRQQYELVSLTERVISDVEHEYPAASITLEGPDTVPVSIKSSLRTALNELVENAVEHAPEPEVTVAIEVTNENVEIRIQDTGPGMPEQERAVLQGETETPMAHGSGLGLWLSYWIVTDHDGTIDTTVTDDGTQVTVTLPRATTGPDVTDQAAVEPELQREQDLFEAVFEEASSALLVVNDDGRAVNLNQRAATLFGRSKSALLGRSLEEFTPEGFDFGTVWTELTDGETLTGLLPLVQSDGIERTVELDGRPNVVPDHHLVRVREVTEREHRERELRRQTERLAETGGWEYDLTTETILWTDGTRRIHEVPDEYEPIVDEAIEFYHPGDRAKIRAAIEQAIEDGEAYRLELRLQTAQGNERWVETTGEPIEADDEIRAIRGAIRDVTERRRRESWSTTSGESAPRSGDQHS